MATGSEVWNFKSTNHHLVNGDMKRWFSIRSEVTNFLEQLVG